MHKLAEIKYCTGCTACASACPKGCITMAADENGFRFPAVDTETCVDCGLCEQACPVITPRKLPETAQQDNDGKLPERINLRSKHTGWSRYQYSNLFQYADGAAHSSVSGESLYMKLFGGGYISRECCESCRFKGYSRVSDLTLGDFWGIWDICPEMDDNKGTSVVLVQSRRGAVVLEQISEKLIRRPVTPEAASFQNQAMLKPMTHHARRQEALDRIQNGGIDGCEAWFINSDAPPKKGLLSRTRRLLGRIKRKIRKG